MQNNGIDLNRTARVIHEALSKTERAIGKAPYPSWEDAEDWQRKSSLDTARTIYANPNASGGAIWRAWAFERQSSGWIYAQVTDKPNRKHEMLPRDGESWDAAFARLPWAEKLKDYVALGAALDDLRAQGAFAASDPSSNDGCRNPAHGTPVGGGVDVRESRPASVINDLLGALRGIEWQAASSPNRETLDSIQKRAETAIIGAKAAGFVYVTGEELAARPTPATMTDLQGLPPCD